MASLLINVLLSIGLNNAFLTFERDYKLQYTVELAAINRRCI